MIALSIALGVSFCFAALLGAVTVRVSLAAFVALEREKRVEDAKLSEIREEIAELRRKTDKLMTSQSLSRARG